MTKISENIESCLNELSKSIDQLAAIKKALADKNISADHEKHLRSYLSDIEFNISYFGAGVDDLAREACDIGEYKIEYVNKICQIGSLTIECDDAPLIVEN